MPATTQPNQREPGLLIASPTGEIRYWENVSMALSGVERWKGVETRLDEGELIRGITLHSSTSFLLSTTQSRIFVVAIASVGGRMEIKIRPFDRAVGWAGSVWNFFGGKGSDPRKGILAIALTSSPSSDEREGKIAFAVADRLVQVWKLSGRDDEGGEKLLIEQDLFAGILEALTGAKPTNEMWALNELKAEILDAQSAAYAFASHILFERRPHFHFVLLYTAMEVWSSWFRTYRLALIPPTVPWHMLSFPWTSVRSKTASLCSGSDASLTLL